MQASAVRRYQCQWKCHSIDEVFIAHLYDIKNLLFIDFISFQYSNRFSRRLHHTTALKFPQFRQFVISAQGHFAYLSPVFFCVWIELFQFFRRTRMNLPQPIWIFTFWFQLQPIQSNIFSVFHIIIALHAQLTLMSSPSI